MLKMIFSSQSGVLCKKNLTNFVNLHNMIYTWDLNHWNQLSNLLHLIQKSPQLDVGNMLNQKTQYITMAYFTHLWGSVFTMEELAFQFTHFILTSEHTDYSYHSTTLLMPSAVSPPLICQYVYSVMHACYLVTMFYCLAVCNVPNDAHIVTLYQTFII